MRIKNIVSSPHTRKVKNNYLALSQNLVGNVPWPLAKGRPQFDSRHVPRTTLRGAPAHSSVKWVESNVSLTQWLLVREKANVDADDA